MRVASPKQLVGIGQSMRLQLGMLMRHKTCSLLGLLAFALSVYLPWYFSASYYVIFRNLAEDASACSFWSLYISSSLVMLALYGLYGLLYYLQSPAIERFKDNHLPWPWKTDKDWKRKVGKALALNFFNHFVLAGSIGYIGVQAGTARYRVELEELPSFPVFASQVLFMMLCDDFVFYWSHRLLHRPWLYPYVHKVHHQFYNSIVIASEYAHPVEYVLGNLLPSLAGAIALGGRAHLLAGLVYTTLRLVETCEAHSGYDFPFSLTKHLPFACSAQYHNRHHLTNVGNYGSFFQVWDSVCGTNDFYMRQLQADCKTD